MCVEEAQHSWPSLTIVAAGGDWIASGDSTGRIRLWRAQDGAECAPPPFRHGAEERGATWGVTGEQPPAGQANIDGGEEEAESNHTGQPVDGRAADNLSAAMQGGSDGDGAAAAAPLESAEEAAGWRRLLAESQATLQLLEGEGEWDTSVGIGELSAEIGAQ